jgi:hypothetical protein
MKLLASGFVQTETTMCGATIPGSSGAQYHFKVEKIIVAIGGSTVAANSSGSCKFVYGHSSDAVLSTMHFPTPIGGDVSSKQLAAPLVIELDNLGINCKWFEVVTNEANTGGIAAWIIGE